VTDRLIPKQYLRVDGRLIGAQQFLPGIGHGDIVWVIFIGAALTGARPHLARAANPVPFFKKASLNRAKPFLFIRLRDIFPMATKEKENNSIGINRDEIITSLYEIRERYILGKKDNMSEHVKKHLHRGFLVRLAMIEHSIVKLDTELGKAKGPLSSYLCIELSLLLNSFYLNISGSLDNLAWALAYHYKMKPSVDENNWQHRKFAQLHNKEFLEIIDKKAKNRLGIRLRSFTKWYGDLKEFRDPGAHRIPLLVPSSIWSEHDLKEQRRLDSEAVVAFEKGDSDLGVKLLRESLHGRGAFSPVFIAEDTKIQQYSVAKVINRDYNNWQELVGVVLKLGFGLGPIR